VILFYDIFRFIYFNGIKLAANWSPKAKLWVDGRKRWQDILRQKFQRNKEDKVIWMHCASLGEFEQGRPILEKVKSQNPKIKIVLTFFSPSGYEIRKNYKGADVVMYLPEDSKENATAFLHLVHPSLAIFVKYEFWHFYLTELRKRNIETILVSGIFRNSQPFFKWWGGFYKNILLNFSHLFVQNQSSATLLASINIKNNVTVCGDTRFDRVIESASNWKPVKHLDAFCKNHFVIIAGSTWQDDEELLSTVIHDHWNNQRLVIAPHEVNDSHIKTLKKIFPYSVCYSELKDDSTFSDETRCLIIDSIGLLSQLYKYADISYIGGGFTKSGIHNVLEAAVYGKTVITGPNIQKFKEAVDLKKAGALFTVNNSTELRYLIINMEIENSGKIAAEFVTLHGGATEAIINYIQEKRLLTTA
jgi:3-deoxy-D-manno-octulosonic-acid transferase